MNKLAIITTHPIQYYAPVFKLLGNSNQIVIKVFYTWGEDSLKKHDPGFGKTIEWDIPLLEGYDYQFLSNTSKDAGSHHFNGIKNPDAINHINQFNPNAILVYGWSYKSHLKIIRHYSGKIPVWFRGDSNLLDHSSDIKNLLRKWALKWIYSHVDKAFYVGTANKAYFIKHGLKMRQLVFAPHAVDNLRFQTDRSTEALSIRKKFGVLETDILILFAGKLESKKDPGILVQAIAELNKPNIHLLYVGNGELEFELKEFVSSHQLIQVHFADFQNQQSLPSWYQACDLFCLPSKGPGETWGLAVNEAMACKKAVLVSDKVGCAADLVKPGLNGEIFQSQNVNSLIENLNKLTKNKQQLFSYGAASAELIQNWNFNAVADTFIKEINS